jgi:hypothetical protein
MSKENDCSLGRGQMNVNRLMEAIITLPRKENIVEVEVRNAKFKELIDLELKLASMDNLAMIMKKTKHK